MSHRPEGYIPAERIPEDILRATEEFARQMEREKREESKIRHPERFLKKDFWKEFCLAD